MMEAYLVKQTYNENTPITRIIVCDNILPIRCFPIPGSSSYRVNHLFTFKEFLEYWDVEWFITEWMQISCSDKAKKLLSSKDDVIFCMGIELILKKYDFI